MRGTTNAHREVIATRLRKIAFGPQLLYLSLEQEILKVGRVVIKVVNLYFPQHPRNGLERVELLPVNEHIPAGEGISRNPVGTGVGLVIAAPMRHRPRLALG